MKNLKAIKTEIYITTNFTGFHCWPAAPEEVSFLRDLHRHVFHVKVAVRVTHDDRDVEFFKLKKDADAVIKLLAVELETACRQMSCEMMAGFIARSLMSGYNVSSVEVSEDGENGARLEFAI